MATAKHYVVIRPVVRTVIDAVNDPVVVLTLSKDEAETLRAIFTRIGGCPRTSRRKHADDMSAALGDIGIRHMGDPRGGIDDNFSGRSSIHFKTDSLPKETNDAIKGTLSGATAGVGVGSITKNLYSDPSRGYDPYCSIR